MYWRRVLYNQAQPCVCTVMSMIAVFIAHRLQCTCTHALCRSVMHTQHCYMYMYMIVVAWLCSHVPQRTSTRHKWPSTCRKVFVLLTADCRNHSRPPVICTYEPSCSIFIAQCTCTPHWSRVTGTHDLFYKTKKNTGTHLTCRAVNIKKDAQIATSNGARRIRILKSLKDVRPPDQVPAQETPIKRLEMRFQFAHVLSDPEYGNAHSRLSRWPSTAYSIQVTTMVMESQSELHCSTTSASHNPDRDLKAMSQPLTASGNIQIARLHLYL